MIDWNLPPNVSIVVRQKVWLILTRMHFGIDLGLRPDQCFRVELYPFLWTFWGTHPNRLNVLYLGPLMISVTPKPIAWDI